MKPIFLTEYAQKRLALRSIAVEHVERIIAAPLDVLPDANFPERRIYQGFIDDAHLLRIVIEETDIEYIVISLYATSKIKKYRKRRDV